MEADILGISPVGIVTSHVHYRQPHGDRDITLPLPPAPRAVKEKQTPPTEARN